MGSKWIWIIASAAYGILTGLIYALLIAKSSNSWKGFWRRFVVWAMLYAAGGLLICRVLWAFFKE